MGKLFNDQQKFDLYLKVLIVASLFCVIISGLLVNVASVEYVFVYSIYEQLPVYFWLFIVLGTMIGELILVVSIFYKGKSNLWVLGLLTILLLNTLLLFLTNSLDYFFIGRGDPLSHIGYTRDIGYFGSISENDIYPAMHILLFAFGEITGLNFFQSAMFIPKYFTLFFFLSIFVLGYKILTNKYQYILFLAFSSLLHFNHAHLCFVPYWETLFTIPVFALMVFILNSSKDKQLGVLLCIFLTFYAFSHPIIVLFAITFLILYDLYNYVFAKLNQSNYRLSLIPYILFATITFFQYNFDFRIVRKNVKFVYQSILFELGGINEFQEGLTKAAEVGMGPLNLVKVILFTHGTYIVFAITTSLCLIYAFHLLFKGIRVDKDILFSGIIATIMYIIATLGLFSFVLFGVNRLYHIGHIFALVFFPAIFVMFLMESGKSRSKLSFFPLTLLLIFIFSLVMLSVFTLYPSPIAEQHNEQVTEANLIGIQTFFSHSDAFDIIEYRSRSARFYHAIYGMEFAKRNNMLNYDEAFPIDHFGYDTYNVSLNIIYPENTYFIDQRLQNFVLSHPEGIRGFNLSDLVRLNSDHSVIRWYDNAEIRIYLIRQ